MVAFVGNDVFQVDGQPFVTKGVGFAGTLGVIGDGAPFGFEDSL
jgi:hypothetical protein